MLLLLLPWCLPRPPLPPAAEAAAAGPGSNAANAAAAVPGSEARLLEPGGCVLLLCPLGAEAEGRPEEAAAAGADLCR
jgi:hypothetical protein